MLFVSAASRNCRSFRSLLKNWLGPMPTAISVLVGAAANLTR